MESSAFGRLIGAVVSPVATFRSIAERPTWAIAFIVVCLSPLVSGLPANPKIDWEDVARANIEASGMDIPDAQAEQQIEAESERRAELARAQHADFSPGVGDEPAETGEPVMVADDEQSKPQPFKRFGDKIGRNDPCPCGSGKKYKQCHGKLA